MVADSECKLSLAAIAKKTSIPSETMRAIFPKIDVLLDALYLDLCAKRNLLIQALHDPTRSLDERVFSIWQGYVIWALNEPIAHKALSRLNLADSPSSKARVTEVLNFPDQEVAERFADNNLFAEHDPVYVDALIIAIVDTTVGLIRLHPEQKSNHLHSGLTLVRRLFF